MKKKLWGLLYIAITLGIVMVVVVKNTDFNELANALKQANWWWLLGGLACMLVYFAFEGIPVYLVYKNHGYKISLVQAIKVGVIGLYYSGITPSSTGGQPMQVIYLTKLNLPLGLSSFVSVLKLIFFQSTMTGTCILGYIIVMQYANSVSTYVIVFLLIGVVINALLLIGVGLLLKKPIILSKILRFVMKIVAKFIGKKAVALRQKGREAIDNFYESYNMSRKNSKDKLAVFVCSLIQTIAYLSVTFFVFKASGLSFTKGIPGLTGAAFIDIFFVQALVFCAVSFFPLPGAAGAQELGFAGFFSPIFGDTLTLPAMLVWRTLTSYLVILTGAGIVTADTVKDIAHKKRQTVKISDNNSEEN